MFSTKRLIVLALVLLLAGVAVYCFLPQPKSNTPVLVSEDLKFEPAFPQLPGIALSEEHTGERWRKVENSPDGSRMVSAEVAYHDGRRGMFQFNAEGSIKSYNAYAADDNARLIYDAQFDGNSGLISRSRVLRADGSVESEFRRSPDDTEEEFFYDQNGVCVRTVSNYPDGSQKVATRGKDNVVSTSEVKAEEKEVTFGEQQGKDGKTFPKFTIKLSGARVSSWEYRTNSGSIRHRGRFLDNGDIEVILVATPNELAHMRGMIEPDATLDQADADEPKPMSRQVWTPVGEDWNRRYYRPKVLEGYDPDGKVSVRCILHNDGQTPKELQHFVTWSGYHKNNAEFYNEQGMQTRYEYYNLSGAVQSSADIPSDQRRQRAVLPAQILTEFPGDKGRLYRLKGIPFAEATPEGGFPATPMFCLP